jgi:hypothetical protein
MTPESWQEKLIVGKFYQLIEAASELGSSVSSVAGIGFIWSGKWKSS